MHKKDKADLFYTRTKKSLGMGQNYYCRLRKNSAESPIGKRCKFLFERSDTFKEENAVNLKV